MLQASEPSVRCPDRAANQDSAERVWQPTCDERERVGGQDGSRDLAAAAL